MRLAYLTGEYPRATDTFVQREVTELRALGLIENRRFSVVPGVPTIGESLPGYAVPDTWFGIMGPANMPRPVVDRLNADIRKSLQDPEVRQRIENIGMEVTGSASADEMAANVKSEVEIIRKIVTNANIKPE